MSHEPASTSSFEPRHVARTHTMTLPLPAPRAFELFTPVGEREWVPDWNPILLHPPDGALERGGSFLTDRDSPEARTLWLVTALDRDRLEVSYARVTPASRIGLVDVRVTPSSAEACHVTVTYTFTAVSEAGNTYLATFTDEFFRSYIESWRDLILAHLARA
jgi:hypothetical protein